MGKLDNALNNVTMTYQELIDIANTIVEPCIKEQKAIVNEIKSNITDMSNESLRDYIIKLSLASYSFSDIKEKSALKAECTEILKKEKYANKFNEFEGSVANKDNNALLSSSEEILVEAMYNYIAAMFKIKLDELHRLVDSLKSIMMSRMSEAKLSMNTEVFTND